MPNEKYIQANFILFLPHSIRNKNMFLTYTVVSYYSGGCNAMIKINNPKPTRLKQESCRLGEVSF